MQKSAESRQEEVKAPRHPDEVSNVAIVPVLGRATSPRLLASGEGVFGEEFTMAKLKLMVSGWTLVATCLVGAIAILAGPGAESNP